MINDKWQMLNVWPKWLWFCVVVLLVAVVAAQLGVSHVLAGRGEELVLLEQRAREVADENRILKDSLYAKTSLMEMVVGAEELGFGQPESVVYLDSKSSVAYVP